MPLDLVTRVWKESPYDRTAKLIHLALAFNADQDGTITIHQRDLARLANASHNWTTQTIVRMVNDGYVAKLIKGCSYNGPTTYRLTFPSQPSN